jgi:hypothetical protein
LLHVQSFGQLHVPPLSQAQFARLHALQVIAITSFPRRQYETPSEISNDDIIIVNV